MKIIFEEMDCIKEYLKKNYKEIFFLLFLAIITYAIKIFNYSISIDTEVTINNLNANDLPWIATGRWGLVLLEKILHYKMGFNPLFSNFIMIVFFTLSIIQLSYLLSKIINDNKVDKKILLILGPFVLTSPTFAEMLNFSMMTGEVAIGLFLLNFSLYASYMAIYKNKTCFYIFSILSLTIVLGVYQAFFPLFIGIAAFIFVLENIYGKDLKDLKKNIFIILKLIIVFFLSYFLCSCITKGLEHYYHLTPSGYLTNQIKWGKEPFYNIYETIKDYFLSILLPNATDVMFNYSYLVAFLGTIIYSIYLVIHEKKKSILIVLALLFFLISPFLLIILTGSVPAYRTQMNLPYVIGLIFILFFIRIQNKKRIALLFCIMCIVFVSVQFKATSDLFYTDYLRFLEDENLTNSIFNKIDMLDNLPQSNRENVTIVFIGMYKLKSSGIISKGDVMGFSFYEWDPATELASNQRIYGFAKTLGYNYIMPTISEVKKAQSYMDDIDTYPSKNSIKVIDNLVVVRVG